MTQPKESSLKFSRKSAQGLPLQDTFDTLGPWIPWHSCLKNPSPTYIYIYIYPSLLKCVSRMRQLFRLAALKISLNFRCDGSSPSVAHLAANIARGNKALKIVLQILLKLPLEPLMVLRLVRIIASNDRLIEMFFNVHQQN